MPEGTETAAAPAAAASQSTTIPASSDTTLLPPLAPTVDVPATASLGYGDKTLELKVIPATEGSSGIEISKLLTTLGVITLDPGFTNT
ncbi:MAG: hypothetical protein ABJD68_11070, partial [Nakamurella sp.]